MLKRLFGLIGLAALAAVATGGYTAGGGGGGSAVSSSIDRQLLGDSSSFGRPAGYDEEYLRPRRFEPKGGVCILQHDGYKSFVSEIVAVSDSIYAADGVRIRATSALITSAVGGALTMSVAQLQSLKGRETDFEIGTHGEAAERMGWQGLYGEPGPRQRVNYDGVTGMSRTFVLNTFQTYQDSLISWGLPAARTHTWANWRTQLGIGNLLREKGIFQAMGIAIPINRTQANEDGNQTFAQQLNIDPLAPAMFGRSSLSFTGYHRIGEPTDQWNIGTYTWGHDISIKTIDSLTAAIDLACHTSSMFVISIHDIGDTTGNANTILPSQWRALAGHISTRMQEGILESLTAEQVAARMRGIRTGNLIPHYGFRKWGTDGAATTLRYNGAAVKTPPGFAPCDTFYAGNPWVDSTGTAAFPKIWNLSVLDTISAAYTARGWADSLTHGLADTSKNVILMEWNSVASCVMPSMTIVTTGCDARYIAITGEVMVLRDPTFQSTDSMYVAIKAGQYAERWDDVVNSGPIAYSMMSDLLGGRNATPAFNALTSASYDQQRVVPLFSQSIAMADTSDTTGLKNTWTGGGLGNLISRSDSLSIGGTAVIANTDSVVINNLRVLSPMDSVQSVYWYGLSRLPALIVHNRSAAWDVVSTIGNRRSVTVAGGAGDALAANVEQIDDYTRPYSFIYYVRIDEMTDYVQVLLSVEALGQSVTSAPSMAILDLAAYPIP